MNVFNIMMAICMVGQPAVCRDHRIQFESTVSLSECVHDAQFYMARWQADNPEWTIKTFRCEPAEAPDVKP
jgi:hypothetical protein